MVEVLLRRRADAGRRGITAAEFAELGWPVCPGAVTPHTDSARHRMPSLVSRGHSRGRGGSRADGHSRGGGQPLASGRACSCDRIGCPAPGAHPVSAAWQIEASGDPAEVSRWWQDRPDASIILVTGRVFDVLEVPAGAGLLALERMTRSPAVMGPVALSADDRALFFVTTRGAPADEDEWWSCHLDCEPGSFASVAGLRWHCRDSYVVAPARAGRGPGAHWIRDPREHVLPDCLRLLEYLADVCEEVLS